jgi:TolB-like protein/tetratricopeptide (TPR) repeat protein
VAILPFANLTGDAGREYITDGLTEELIADLGRVKDLGVIARTSVMRFKDGTRSVAEIARELKVDYVLEGSVREAGQRLRVTAQLIRARDEVHVWAETYDRDLHDLLSVQTEVALRVAREARLRLPPPRAPGVDGEAYLAYLHGRYFWNERSEEGFRRGLAEFQRALERDPRFAPAWSGLADTYALMSNYGLARPRDVMPKAGEAARRALALDDGLAEGHASLALVLSSYDWDFAGAEREFKRALALNPNYALAHLWYGLMLQRLGRLQESQAALQRGLDADPLSATLRSNLDDLDFRSRRYEEAVARYRASLERDPGRAFNHFELARGLCALGRYEEAGAQIARARELRGGDDPMFTAFAAYIRGRAGDREGAAAELRRLEEDGARHVPPYYLALVATGLGDKDRAFRHLEQALEERHVGAVSIREDPEFEALRGDPRFGELLRRVGFQGLPAGTS